MNIAIAAWVTGVCLLTSPCAFAVDYDYQQAHRVWQDRDRQLDLAEADLDREEAELTPLEQRVANAQTRVDTLTTQLRDLRDRQHELEVNINTEQANVQRYRRERADLVRALDNLERELPALEGQLNAIQQTHQQNLTALSELDRRIADLEAADPDDPALPGLRRDRDSLAAEVGRQEQQMTQLAQKISSHRTAIDRHETQIAAKDQAIETAEGRIQTYQDRLADVRRNISNKEVDLDNARDVLADARAARDRQLTVVAQAQTTRDIAYREERAAYNYYQQVLANYQNGKNAAIAHGSADGSSHGDREGDERAAAPGDTAGSRDGTSSGHAAGLADSEIVAHVRGYNYGLRNGETDPALASALARGRDDGVGLARRKAQAEDFPRAYNTRLNELFAAQPTHEATEDITDVLPEIPGATGPVQDGSLKPIGSVEAPNYTDKGEPAVEIPAAGTPTFSVPATDRRYFRPNCSSEPHPDFVRACDDAYTQAYPTGYDSGYRQTYRSSYASAFRPAATTAYNAARQTQHPTIYAQAAQIGAHDVGLLLGFRAELPSAQAAAAQAGRQAVEALRARGSLPLLRSVGVSEAVDDGNLSPGEGVKIKIVLDNYGLKNAPKESLQLRLTDLTGGAFSVLVRQLPAVAADTRLNLVGVLTGAAAEAAGRALSFKAVLEEVGTDGTTTTLDEATFEGGIRQPLELAKVTFPSALTIGTPGTAVLTLTNNTTTAFEPVTLPLALEGLGLTTTATQVELPALAEGESKAVSVAVTADEYASLTVPITFALRTQGIAGSTPQRLASSVGVPASRVGQLELCLPTCGSLVSLPLHVKAGATFWLPSQFRFTGTQSRIFEFGKLQVSDARITSANNSTIRVGPASWGPGSSPYAVNFGYVVPAALKGQTHWVSLYLKQGSTRIQALKIPIVVD
jgi:septal ring factor EnvC (AmiA/AmiB activator)